MKEFIFGFALGAVAGTVGILGIDFVFWWTPDMGSMRMILLGGVVGGVWMLLSDNTL